MLKIQHRVNRIEQLKILPLDYGVELDLRSNGEGLILHHDPFCKGDSFEEYLKHYRHQFMILNTKEEGLESAILALLAKYHIRDYFFLDLSLPFLIKHMNQGLKDIAVRFSEYEPLPFVLNFKEKVKWVWVDCFSDLPLTPALYSKLHPHFKLCLVSPELQGHPLDYIETFKKQLEGCPIDAVCTKRPDLW